MASPESARWSIQRAAQQFEITAKDNLVVLHCAVCNHSLSGRTWRHAGLMLEFMEDHASNCRAPQPR